MSCVAEANAVTQKTARVAMKGETGAFPEAIVPESGDGRDRAPRSIAAVIRSCMDTVHHLLVLMISTNGLQTGLITHGRYSNPVNMATSPFDMPIFLNMMTDTVLTRT